MYNLFLDDERFPPTCSSFFEDGDPIIVRSWKEFNQVLQEYGVPNKVSFDHDLGEEKSGLDCYKQLIRYCLWHNADFPEIDVHSQNPIGAKAIWDYEEFVDRHETEMREEQNRCLNFELEDWE